MKKALLFVALLLTAAGSWAFYPKPAEPGEYMMVVSRFSATAVFRGKNTLSVIASDGQTQKQEYDVKNGSLNKLNDSFDQLHQDELRKLNELHQLGWRVVTNNQMIVSNGAINETTYLLEKK